jgi:hypothetical protein
MTTNVIIGIGVAVVLILVAWPLIAKVLNKPATTPTTLKSGSDPAGDLRTKIQTWLASLGIVQKIEQLDSEVNKITAFAVVVLIQPHVVGVVDSTQAEAVNNNFNEILSAISTKAITPPTTTVTK